MEQHSLSITTVQREKRSTSQWFDTPTRASGSQAKKRIVPMVVVLGMHRSGTSVMTHILSKAGFFVGEGSELMQGNQWNRNGYFERWPVLKTNDLILNLCNGSWHSPPEASDIARIRIDPQIESLLRLYKGHERGAIKDPRMCLTFPVWRRVLGEKMRIVHITRQPEAIAASLMRRDGFPKERSFLLAKIYEERAAKYARSYPHLQMQYEDLFSSRRKKVLSQLSTFLGMEKDLDGIAAKIVDSTLRHDNGKDPISTSGPQEAYKKVLTLVKEGKREEAIAALEKLVALWPDHAVALNDLGVLYYQKGEIERAVRHLKGALKIDPHNTTARENHEKIDGELRKASSIRSLENRELSLHSKKAKNVLPWWGYAKFSQRKVKVLLVSLRHLLLSEVGGALRRLGHDGKVLLIGNQELDRASVERMFTQALKDFQPDFVLTINHLGFDQEGVVTGLLTHYRVPFASWYVDSPHLIIHHYACNKSPYLTLFLWDRDYVEIAKGIGFDKVEYLPLGVDEKLFRPARPGENPLAHLASDVSFVGNSMVMKVKSVLVRNGINGSLLANFESISRAFNETDHLVVRDMMAELFPDLTKELMRLPEPQALGYEAGVTWQATGWYRGGLVKQLKPFRLLIVGDQGWKGILENGAPFHSELNYYSDLPFFYNTTKVSFNATSRQMKNGINQRVFDVPACRSVVLTDWTSQLESLMEPNRDLLAYRNGEEIPELVNRALSDGQFRKKISDSGYKRVLGEHTYTHRVKKLVEIMKRAYG